MVHFNEFVQKFFGAMFVIAMLGSCGPLPRPGTYNGTLQTLALSSDATGLVLGTADSSYTSSSVYFYNFGSGSLNSLATGESGDLFLKWDGFKLWMFNRSSGRTSYSSIVPKEGVSTRSIERRTPDTDAGDPTDWISVSDNEVILAQGVRNRLSVAKLFNGISVASDFSSVDTGSSEVPFRPGLFVKHNSEIMVLHQSLNFNWQAVGGGSAYSIKKSTSGLWSWNDQNTAQLGIQGSKLFVSNPVASMDCSETTCRIAGACYSTMGVSCVAGVDLMNWLDHSVSHLFDWPKGYVSAGSVSAGVQSNQVIACLKSSTESSARLVSLDSTTGIIGSSWDAGAAYCGAFKVDRAGGRVFAMKSSGTASTLYILNEALTVQSQINLPFSVSDLVLINE